MPLGNWSIKYYDFSLRPLPPVMKQPGARPTPPHEPEFVGACRAMLDFPEPKAEWLISGFIGELLGWFGSIASCHEDFWGARLEGAVRQLNDLLRLNPCMELKICYPVLNVTLQPCGVGVAN
ncbi:MAG: hypothetical protein RMI00_06635, partial [Sulfolobales archaeon]|nr:hypothetical protein [Sulfolobales archaeon]